MKIQRIASRKNDYIKHLRKLQKSRSYRRECGEYLCDGGKMLAEALQAGADVTSVLWKEPSGQVEHQVNHYDRINTDDNAPAYVADAGDPGACGKVWKLPDSCREWIAPEELFRYVSPLENSPGPLFTVSVPDNEVRMVRSAIVLENVQDPGNVGTVLRTAAAFGIDAVVLCGDCADIYNPKTVRSTMGAVFRQYVYFCSDPLEFAKKNGLKLYGAALRAGAADLRQADLSRAAVCIGNEGHGLSGELLDMCDGQLIIPMMPGAESLNAGVAASIAMWEMVRKTMPESE